MIQAARVAGAVQVIAVEPRASRRAVAAVLGATHVVDPGEGDPAAQVRALTDGRGPDYVLEAAGSPGAQVAAIAMARRAGTVVLTGLESLAATLSVSQVDLALRGKTVRSCQNGMVRMRRDLPRFVRMIEQGLVDAAPIITSRYRLDDIEQARAASDARRDLTGVIVFGAAATAAGA
jgi:Zn-dependent alcohol dehydrogenase